MILNMSCRAAPLPEVTMPIVSGRNGNVPLSLFGKQTLRGKFFLELFEGEKKRALPLRLHFFDVELQVAAHGIDAHPAET